MDNQVMTQEIEKVEREVAGIVEQRVAPRNTAIKEEPNKPARRPTGYSYARACRALLYGWDGAETEKKVHDTLLGAIGEPSNPRSVYIPYSIRDLSEGDDALGGYLVSPSQSAEIIDLVQKKLVFSQGGLLSKAGVGVPEPVPLPKSGQIDLPKFTQGFTGYWVGEATTITKSDWTLGQVQLRPQKLGVFVVISNELLRDATPGVEGFIRRQMAYAIAEQEEKSILYGSGANRPTGILDANGVVKNPAGADLGANGGTPNIDNILSMMEAFESEGGDLNNACFIMAPRTKYTLLKIKETDGGYILEPDLTLPLIHRFKGVPVITSPLVPVNLTKGTSTDCSFIILGDFSKLLMGRHVVLEIELDQQFAFQNDQAAFRAIERVDWVPANPKHFVVMDGVRA